MPQWRRRAATRFRAWTPRFATFVVVAVLGLGLEPSADIASAQSSMINSKPLKVGFFVSSDGNRCFTPGLVTSIKYFATKLADQVNASGGIDGRKVVLTFLDDFEQAETTVANVKEAINDPSMMAMIGVPSSTRGRAVFKALGPEIRAKAIPFITEMSLDNIFNDYPNVFTMASSVRNELEVVRKIIAAGGYGRPVFVGLDDDLYSFALGDGVKDIPGGPALAGSYQVPVRDYKLDPEASAPVVEQIKRQNPDLILLSIHSGPSATLLNQLTEAGVDAPVFVLLGRISSIANRLGPQGYAGTMSQIAREGVPNVYSERLRQRIWRSRQDTWVFDDIRNKDAAGWRSGTCDARPDAPPRQLFDGANRRAVGRGTQYRDMLQLVIEAARSAPDTADTSELRRHIGTRLRNFVEGRHVLKGLWQDWAFTTDRTAADDTLILSKAIGDDAPILAPVQYRRINGTLQRSPTVYASIDLINLSRIDANDRSFDAEFYLSMKSADDRIGIENIEFTNAYRSQAGEGRLVSVREIHNGLGASDFSAGVKLYKISGKFVFEPDLGSYPFDTQRLSVSFQPTSAEQSFLIQPSAQNTRQSDVAADGWHLVEQYVGSDQDIIPTIGATLSERRIVPFYKFNATWVVKRIAVDYYLRVVVPLAFILLVTYFSVYLPHERFDSIMAIQVTALLSSIALYLALPKVDSDQATLSDKIFMMTYAAVSLMIGLSILKDNLWQRKSRVFSRFVALIQRVVFPVATVAVITFLLTNTTGQTAIFTDRIAAFWNKMIG